MLLAMCDLTVPRCAEHAAIVAFGLHPQASIIAVTGAFGFYFATSVACYSALGNSVAGEVLDGFEREWSLPWALLAQPCTCALRAAAAFVMTWCLREGAQPPRAHLHLPPCWLPAEAPNWVLVVANFAIVIHMVRHGVQAAATATATAAAALLLPLALLLPPCRCHRWHAPATVLLPPTTPLLQIMAWQVWAQPVFSSVESHISESGIVAVHVRLKRRVNRLRHLLLPTLACHPVLAVT